MAPIWQTFSGWRAHTCPYVRFMLSCAIRSRLGFGMLHIEETGQDVEYIVDNWPTPDQVRLQPCDEPGVRKAGNQATRRPNFRHHEFVETLQSELNSLLSADTLDHFAAS